MKPEEKAQNEKLLEAAHTLAQNQTGIVLSGRIVNGKVELDQRTLDVIAKQFTGANRAFVAVNAPFDPQPSTV